ncbi:hypothetical protein A3F02_03170 [Candidatus Curtissbacteria bacterium RIFCSPHIGHO2_12_FULL_38_9b]|uniref:Uncharacterized protein n=2 Tax=Candidatus Curtissiibacteriota TaxID=1752717 RepID=A0A1F5GTN7_9BACT|nr:MAG: hypothetical protein A3F02_03170 [Candidatus Curtissbacteria bacterium RIFCSPHIGHO2_12_FULL_38_9b]OGD95249.1 MAG: hypothetical protein A3A48_02025 [Candidatus Curtissbacteria bacterium RIFCSPLOWO2_01_FULL_37_9]
MEQENPGQPQSRLTTSLRAVPLKSGKLLKILPVVIIILIITIGVISGLVMSSVNKAKNLQSSGVQDPENLSPEVKESFTQTFRDESEGIIEKNDQLDKYAQGTHKLIRPGGESQTAYLTSSVLDLDTYLGKKVKIFGETFGSSQVGWLMDVGKVEILN